ncbi:hypothetical protein DAPPUDRAFT_271558 [Daphnia pulex]|uniref:Tudor domain-containing protein n=1 Tax=Daphnia pulex TaxID=6669 RepID=E9I286_DAPPU|nr:hypothetical protein DAPPUDRAFT_271558 [Daphnia pulex]|eukprot:EFX61894.1 hypothetical protein DAPPUDRAFT_271558 [Daphnia pulex]
MTYPLRDTGSNWSLREMAIFGAKMSSKTWTAVPIDFINECQSVRLFDATNRPLVNLLASMGVASDFCSTHLTLKSTPLPVIQGNPTTITQILGVNLAAEENLFVTFSEKPGSFFGKLEKMLVEAKDEMATELFKVYSSLPYPPFLYVDDLSRLGHYGVLQWNEGQNYNSFRRVLITSELANDLLEPQLVTTIMERIHSLILDPKFVNQKDISATIGKPCLAFYPVDGKWHRAIVKALNGNMITVCYVDYGISYTLRTSYLRELHQDLITLPALAFKCCLDGSEFLSKIVADTLKDRFLKSSAFAAQFCNVVDGVLHIRLRHVQTMGPNLLN